MKRKAILLTTALMVVLMAVPAGAVTYNYKFMAGPMGGSWYPLGGAVAEILQGAIPSLTIAVQPGAGIVNVKALESKRAELGWSNSVSAVDAGMGRAPFKKKVTNFRHMLTMYFAHFQAVVRKDSGITKFEDLKGKRICPNKKGSTSELVTRYALKAHGLTYDDMSKVNFGSLSNSINLIKDGHTDCFTVLTTIPYSGVIDVNSVRPVKLLEITDQKLEELNKVNSGLKKGVIPANTYSGVDYDVQTFENYMHMIVRDDIPDDLVYKMTKILVENRDRLGNVVSSLKGVKPEFMATDVGVEYHPGALKYFKETGIIK